MNGFGPIAASAAAISFALGWVPALAQTARIAVDASVAQGAAKGLDHRTSSVASAPPS